MSAITTKPCCVASGKETDNSKQQHALIQQVDDWECNSINKIRETAEAARRLILKHTTERVSQIEEKLSKLVDQLRQSREQNNFVSKDVCQWQEEMAQLTKQLVVPSNITVRHISTPIVTKIHVDLPGKNANCGEAVEKVYQLSQTLNELTGIKAFDL